MKEKKKGVRCKKKEKRKKRRAGSQGRDRFGSERGEKSVCVCNGASGRSPLSFPTDGREVKVTLACRKQSKLFKSQSDISLCHISKQALASSPCQLAGVPRQDKPSQPVGTFPESSTHGAFFAGATGDISRRAPRVP